MKRQTWAKLALGLAALVPLSTANYAQAQAVDELERSLETDIGEPQPAAGVDDATADGAIEELTRGPVHEAFAEQVSADAKPGLIVPEAPPDPINEVPPESKPADAKAIWIDGYWAYDDVDKRYIWISGVWRVAPAGYRWTPGYWTEAEGGFRWIGGFWASAERAEVAYQPEPPASIEEGPTSAAPSETHIWVPGCWIYRDADYAWRPGYWTEGNDNWVWIPNYYRYTPRGHVLCGGYWDVPLATRGSLFAPVYFNRPIYTTPNWHYTPRVAIGLGPLHFHLFVRPNYCHYYFGDYYGSNYHDRGWYPWHTFHRHRHWHDPLFAFNVWRYQRRGIDFYDRYDRWHDYYNRHEDRRPRHTWEEQRDWVAERRDDDDDGRDQWKHSAIAERFEDRVRENKDRFVSVDESQRERFKEINERVRDFRRERAKSESVADARDGRDGDGQDGDREGARRERPTLRLPNAMRGGGPSDRQGRDRDGRDGRGDDDREGRDEEREGRDERDPTDRNPDRDGDRDPARPDVDRGDVTPPRGDRPETAPRPDRPDRTPRGEDPTPPPDTTPPADTTPTTPETPAPTPTTPAAPSTTPEAPAATPGEGRDSALPSLPRVERNDRIDRVRGGVPDRSSLLPQPGTVRDSERPFNTERRSETLPRDDDPRRTPAPDLINRDGSDSATPQGTRLERPRLERPSTQGVDRTPRLDTTPRPDFTPRVDRTPRVEGTLPRVESPRGESPRTINRDSFESRQSPRTGPSIRSGGDRPSITPSAPRIQQPSATPRVQEPRRIETNRPSFNRAPSQPRESRPSISPRSSGQRSSAPSFSPRSGGGDRSPSMSRGRSGGGGGGSSIRSSGGGGNRSSGGGGGGDRSGGGRRGGGDD